MRDLVHKIGNLFFFRQVESTNAEIELALNKLKTEEATLRDQLAKMQAVNEGLAQDKVELHKVIAEVCLSEICFLLFKNTTITRSRQ